MAKKKAAKRDQASRIDVSEYGIDLPALVAAIRKHLEGTDAEIAARAGGISAKSVNNVLNGHVKPSLGYVAALAKASGGRLVVRYEPPKKR